jgi:PPM family protein phosphatase
LANAVKLGKALSSDAAFVELGIGSHTDRGRVRTTNEDACLVLPALRLFVVSDGMGGQAHGEVASALTVETVVQNCSSSDALACDDFRRADLSEKTNRLACAVESANSKIYQAALADPQLRGMGATVVAAWLDNFRLSLVHVGDSRAYLLRLGSLQHLTADHTLVAEQVKSGLIKAEEAHLSKIQNILTRALGAQEHVESDAAECTLANADVLLLCTDGLTRMVSDTEIAEILLEFADPQASAERLVRIANEHGGQDNITVIVLHIGGHLVVGTD